MRFWSKRKTKKEIKEAIVDTNKFLLASIAILLMMLPLIGSVLAGVVLYDYIVEMDISILILVLLGIVLLLAYLKAFERKTISRLNK